MQTTAHVLCAMVSAALMSACVTDTQFLAQNTAAATQTAESRAKFELDCPQVQTTILSQKVVQSIQGYGWRGAGMHAGPWTEYTIGIRRCGRQAVYMALCRDPENCNAFAQGATFNRFARLLHSERVFHFPLA